MEQTQPLILSAEIMKCVQLLLSLGALIWISFLFLNCVKSKLESCKQSGGNTGSKWIHTLYIGGIATFILLEFIVYIVLNNDNKDNVIDTVTFGATLSSLIMSIVAIIFTIVSGKDNQSQLGKINQATEKLEQTAASLNAFKTAAAQIETHIDEFNTKVTDKIAELNSSIDIKIGEINGILCDVRNDTQQLRQNQASEMNKPSRASGNDGYKFSVQNYLIAGSYLGALSLLATAYSFKTQKAIDFKELGQAFKYASMDYVHGYLVASCACGIIEFTGSLDDMKVAKAIDSLDKFCIEKIKDYLKPQPEALVDDYVDGVNQIATYFGQANFTKEELYPPKK